MSLVRPAAGRVISFHAQQEEEASFVARHLRIDSDRVAVRVSGGSGSLTWSTAGAVHRSPEALIAAFTAAEPLLRPDAVACSP
jgi:hypothetical protein